MVLEPVFWVRLNPTGVANPLFDENPPPDLRASLTFELKTLLLFESFLEWPAEFKSKESGFYY
jgi:hypothetical protein